MINYVTDPTEAEWKGYFYAFLMFLAAVLQSIFVHQYFHRGFITGMRIRTAVVAAVYKKVSFKNYSLSVLSISLSFIYTHHCLLSF